MPIKCIYNHLAYSYCGFKVSIRKDILINKTTENLENTFEQCLNCNLINKMRCYQSQKLKQSSERKFHPYEDLRLRESVPDLVYILWCCHTCVVSQH